MDSIDYDILRREGMLFDFTISVGDKEFRAHKFVLATHSEYFRAMFRNEMLESKSGKLILHHVDTETTEHVLNFCYTGRIDLTNENVPNYLQAASFLQMETLKKFCISFATHALDESNCLEILNQAWRERLSDLEEISFLCCCANFEKISKTEDFLSLDYELLEKMIKDDRLIVNNEAKVLDAVVEWIKTDDANRKPRLDDLGPFIRFALLGPVSLVEISQNSLFMDSAVCSNLIDMAKNYHILSNHWRAGLTDQINTRPRDGTNERGTFIYAFHYEFKRYDPQENVWTKLASVNLPSGRLRLARSKNSIFVIDLNEDCTTLRVDIEFRKVHRDVPDRVEGIGEYGQIVAHDDCIFAIGKPGNLMEKYSPIDKKWRKVGDRPMLAHCLSSPIVHNGHIYVAVGDVGQSTSIWTYDIQKEIWRIHSQTRRNRVFPALCFCRGKLYAIGWCDSRVSAECFDEVEQCWFLIAPTVGKALECRAVEHNGLLYLIHNGGMECYDPDAGFWTQKNGYSQIVEESIVWCGPLAGEKAS